MNRTEKTAKVFCTIIVFFFFSKNNIGIWHIPLSYRYSSSYVWIYCRCSFSIYFFISSPRNHYIYAHPGNFIEPSRIAHRRVRIVSFGS
jgi:hypothetical protein